MFVNDQSDIASQPEARSGQRPEIDSPPKQAPQIRAAMEVAKDAQLDAARLARSSQVAARLGLPVNVVASDLQYAHQESIARELEKNPLLAEWAGKNEFSAAYAAHDPERLRLVFEKAQREHEDFWKHRPDLTGLEKFGKLLEEGTTDVLLGIDSAIAGTLRFFSHGDLRDSEGNKVDEWESPALADFARSQEEFVSNYRRNGPIQLEAKSDFGNFLYDVVRQAPQIFGQVAATLASGPLASMGFMGAQIAGGQYQRLIEQGIDPDRAFAAGLMNAAIQTPLEQLGISKFTKMLKAKGVANVAKRAAEGVLVEGATEFLQEFPETGTEIWARLGQTEGAKEWFQRFGNALPQTIKNGLYSATVVAPYGIIGGAARAAAENARQRRADAWAKQQEELCDLIGSLSPEARESKSILENMLEATGQNREIGISPDALFQLHDQGSSIMADLGITEDELALSMATGMDVPVSLTRLHVFASPEDVRALVPHARETPEAPTQAEAQAQRKQNEPVNQQDQEQGPVSPDVARVVELYQNNMESMKLFEQERDRLRQEAFEYVRQSPNLRSQAEAMPGGVTGYVNSWMNLMERYAWRMGAANMDPVDFLRKVTFSELYANGREQGNAQQLNQDEDKNGNPIFEIDPQRLGVAPDADLRTYIRAGREFYRELQKKTLYREDLGEIRFTRAGFNEMAHTGSDKRKWLLVPYLEELISKATYIGPEELNKSRNDDIVRYHWLEAEATISGKKLRLGIAIAEDRAGNKFYNINQDLEGWQGKYGPYNKRAFASHRQVKGELQTTLSQDESSSVENNLNAQEPDVNNKDSFEELNQDDLNLFILNQEDIQQNPRGATRIYPETYLIKLFDGANLSTLLHETGHVFFEEMAAVVEAGAADQAMIDDFEKLRKWLGAADGATLTTEQREQAARGFEVYLMEGKAPTAELDSVFARFRRWLTRIYQSVMRLNAPLTDEVRQVFGRMISIEQEVNQAADNNSIINFTTAELDTLGLTGAERKQFEQMPEEARQKAGQKLLEMRNENRDARLARYRREALQELSEDRTYIARDDLRKTPLDLESIIQNFGEKTARDLRKKMPWFAKSRDGVDPEIFAAERGYNSASEMIADLLKSKNKGVRIREIVEAKERESDSRFDALQAMLETEEIGNQLDLAARKLADLLGEEHLDQRAFRQTAQIQLGQMPMRRAISTPYFLGAMRRSMADFRSGLLAGDRKRALNASRKALLHYEFARQSRYLEKSTDRLSAAIEKFMQGKDVDTDAKYALNVIASNHGLDKPNMAIWRGRNQQKLDDWLKELEMEGYDLFLDHNLAFADQRSWKELTADEYGDLADAMRQIITVERNRRKLLTARRKAELDQIAADIASTIYANRKGDPVRTVQRKPGALKFLERAHASHTKIEALCLAVDGDKMGPTWEYIYRPITEAENDQAIRLKEAAEQIKKLFDVYTKKELSRMSKKEYVEKIGESITHENRLAMALNMGNEQNRDRLRSGHNWTDEQITACVSTLTERDWNFVQSVWDYLETFRDESFALQQEVTGLRPKAVEASPFTVKTSDGKKVKLKGGYYPIAYNSDLSYAAYRNEQKQMDQQFFGGRNYGAAQTRQGHLRERGKKGLQAPLQLELSVATNHVFNTIHDLAYRKAVLDVAKVIKYPTVRQAFETHVGHEMYRQLEPWLMDIANERQEPMHGIDRALRWARSSSTMMQMGLKATTIAMQPVGITQTIDVLGYGWTMRGLARAYRHPMQIMERYREMCARSKFMETRIQSYDRDIKDMTRTLHAGLGRFGWLQKIREKAFVPMGICQMGVDLPTWWGAYEKGLQDYKGDEIEAALYADSIVRQSQGSGSIKDLSRIQRGSEAQKLFTMFYSYFNTFYNLGARRIRQLREDHSPAGIFRAANHALLLWFIPVILSEYMAGRAPDKDKEWWKWAAPLIIAYPFQAIVGVRDVANAMTTAYDYKMSPATSAPESLVKWVDKVKDLIGEGKTDGLAKASAEAAGFVLCLPAKQAVITLGNMWDWLTDDDPDFELRDLVYAKQKNRQKR